LLVAVALLAVAAGVAGCPSNDEGVPAGELRIATGSPGGVYFTYGRGIADAVRRRIPELRPSVLETAASAQNIRLVTSGEAEIGFAQADTAAELAGGGARVVALARLYDDYLHLVVRKDSAINKIADLNGKRVSIGARESGTIGTTQRLLRVAGIDPDTAIQPHLLSLDESAGALAAGTIDAFFFSGGLPVARVRDLAARLPLRLIPIGQYASALRASFGQYYAEHTVPESTYGLPPVSTIGIPNYLVVSPDMPESAGYALTRLLFGEQAELAKAHPVAARLNPREAIYTHPLALHPGAVRYFREIKP
jgi:TRAP transporter TAXI family solute receptor